MECGISKTARTGYFSQCIYWILCPFIYEHKTL